MWAYVRNQDRAKEKGDRRCKVSTSRHANEHSFHHFVPPSILGHGQQIVDHGGADPRDDLSPWSQRIRWDGVCPSHFGSLSLPTDPDADVVLWQLEDRGPIDPGEHGRTALLAPRLLPLSLSCLDSGTSLSPMIVVRTPLLPRRCGHSSSNANRMRCVIHSLGSPALSSLASIQPAADKPQRQDGEDEQHGKIERQSARHGAEQGLTDGRGRVSRRADPAEGEQERGQA